MPVCDGKGRGRCEREEGRVKGSGSTELHVASCSRQPLVPLPPLFPMLQHTNRLVQQMSDLPTHALCQRLRLVSAPAAAD